MKKSNFLWLGLAITLLTVGTGCGMNKTNNQINSDYQTTSTPPTTADGSDDLAVSAVIEPGNESVQTKTGTVNSPTKNYTDALKIYQQNGYRFQFSKCSGTPGTLNIKKNTSFMIDNRDNQTHQISIAGITYVLKAYDFGIAHIAKAGSYNITCDGGGAAHINVEN